MKALGIVAAVATVLPLAGPVRAQDQSIDRSIRQRLAVLIVGATASDSEIADNLTEVVIARIAQSRRAEVVGTAEFRKRLGMESENRARLCLEDAACVGTVAVSLGVTSIVSGSVGLRERQYLFALVLRDMHTGEIQNRLFRLVDGNIDQLVRAAQQATDALFVAPPAPGHVRMESEPSEARVSIDDAYVGTTPLISGNLVAGKHRLRVEKEGHFPWKAQVDVPPGGHLEINLTPDNLPRRKSWPTYVAYGTAGAAVLLLATGAVLGTMAQVEPTARSRAVAQDQFEERRQLGLAADAAFVASGLVAAASLYVFWHYREHIFGRD